MKFDTLRLSGFKSFVDPTELRLEPGLTGVVGPNGCGKSNLLEAMRWVMGESSAKSMRGEGMDDVIFAGAATRPPRNFAEVSLMISNEERLAPPQFGEADTLEVVRRITRDIGSVYRVNGKESRARDVKMLFADAASGAQSPALVRQGRIGELIAAKPQGRRKFLEEAAGVSGLYVRRREAELKLKAAEENLLRVDDVLLRLDAQINALRRQARQAERYSKLSDQIQETGALLVWRRYAEADADAVAAQATLDEATRVVAAATTTESETARKRNETTEALPPLREEAAIAQAVFQRLLAKRDGLDAEAERARETLARLETELTRVTGDIDREGELNADAKRALAELEAEQKGLENEQSAAVQIAGASEKAQTAASAVATAETALDGLTARAAAASAERSAAERARREAESALNAARSRLDDVTPQLAALAAEISSAETAVTDSRAAKQAATESAQTAPDRIAKTEEARKRLETEESDARAAVAAVRANCHALSSEAATLERTLSSEADSDFEASVISSVRAAPGYEAALAAALGDDATAPVQEDFSQTRRGWLDLAPFDAPGTAGHPLSAYVEAPDALARCLAMTSVIAREEGPEAQKRLAPGQNLVSREGDLWRWDGYFAGAESRQNDPTALRLARLNRLDALKGEIEREDGVLAEATTALDLLERQLADARLDESNARAERQQIEDTVAGTTRSLADAEATLERKRASQIQLTDEEARQAETANRAGEALAEADEALSGIGDPTALRDEAETARTALLALRGSYNEAKAAHDELVAAERARASRLEAIGRELAGWRDRAAKAEARSTELRDRQQSLAKDHEAAQSAPEQIASARDALSADLTTGEARVTAATDAMASAEADARQAARESTDAAAALASAREARARAEALTEAATARKEEAADALREESGQSPQDVAAKMSAQGDDDAEQPSVADIEARLAKLKMDRERLGAVNLRAAIEIQEAETERDALGKERDDLEEAIAKLRKGLAALNREGRERLLAAFTEVNAHFAGLFTHLFGGGEARLELTESDDPLEAGLEIMCQPPGKRLQSLSLLSGGEQTLTALALIFAVFLVNPAPVCVLDEVDAPLDDANVGRFCDLLDEMTRRADARFLIITHHAVTMARMNRLFGVTMVERGVSRLVSVDLGAAVDLVADAPLDPQQAERPPRARRADSRSDAA